MREKWLANAAPRVLLFLVFVFLVGLRLWPNHATGFRVRIASDTCEGEDTTILLRVSTKGLLLAFEPVKQRNLAGRLADIYGSRTDRVLYLAADDDVPFRDVVAVVEILQQSKHIRPSQFRAHEMPLPEALQSQPGENLNIEIRLVTLGAVAMPCREGCYNWWYVWNPVHTRFDYLVPPPRMM